MFMVNNTKKFQIEIYFPDNESTGWCNKMLSYRYDLQVWNAPRDVDSATFSTESPVYINTTGGTTLNVELPGSRCVVYARGCTDQKLVQKDQGTSWADGTAITSLFRRDNIKLLPNYSEHIYVHRIFQGISYEKRIEQKTIRKKTI